MIVYLVRHAERIRVRHKTEREELFLGLSELGKLQAHSLAWALKKEKINKIVHSPILRAKETALIMQKELGGVYFEEDNRLVEFMASPDETDDHKKTSYKLQAINDPTKRFFSGESLEDALQRFEKALNDATSSSLSEICIVGHRVVFEYFLFKRLGVEGERWGWLSPASVTKIYFEDGRPKKILYLNKTFRNKNLVKELLKKKITTLFDKVF